MYVNDRGIVPHVFRIARIRIFSHIFSGGGHEVALLVRSFCTDRLFTTGDLHLWVCVRGQIVVPYRDPKLGVEQRVADLLSRMTLEEKVAQPQGTWQNRQFPQDPKAFFVDEKGAFVPERAAVTLKNGLGEFSRPSQHRGPREMAQFTNTVQRWLMENTRMGIPALFHEECLHGQAALGGTAYPQAIGLASTWDPSSVQEVFSGDCSRSACSWGSAMFDACPGPCPGSVLGAHRGNLRRRPLPCFAHRSRRHPRLSRNRGFDRRVSCDRHCKTFRRARTARGRNKRGPRQLFRAGDP